MPCSPAMSTASHDLSPRMGDPDSHHGEPGASLLVAALYIVLVTLPTDDLRKLAARMGVET